MLHGIRDVVNAELEGRVRNYGFVKNFTLVNGANAWFDVSMSSGNPIAKYWFDATPLIAKRVAQSTDGGIFHGASVSPSSKYLRSISIQASTALLTPLTLLLCDYLLYYPTIDEGTLDPQVLDNTIGLSRYADGAGVQMIAVSIAARAGGQFFTVSYTNQDGVSGRTSIPVQESLSAIVGNVVTFSGNASSISNLFIPLQDGDTGVRSVESVTMSGSDTGLFSLILVKPLATIDVVETGTVNEKDFLITSSELPEIKDDAYLSFLSLPIASLSSRSILGSLKVIW